MNELERFLVILAKRLCDNAYPESGPFGRAELADYILEAHVEAKREIEEELRWQRECGKS